MSRGGKNENEKNINNEQRQTRGLDININITINMSMSMDIKNMDIKGNWKDVINQTLRTKTNHINPPICHR